jgi:hypothetical protein
MLAPDFVELKPSLVIQLTDSVTGARQLAGQVDVQIGAQAAAFQKENEASFVFLNLAAGTYDVTVASVADTPYYLPNTIKVTLPLTSPRWPAFPDLGLADLTKPLDDPAQPAAYRAQRASASMMPGPAYPFPAGATLLRGTVKAGDKRLAGALVKRNRDSAGYTTGSSGEYVLYFGDIPGRSQAATIVASFPGKPDVSAAVTLLRAATVSVDFVMAP